MLLIELFSAYGPIPVGPCCSFVLWQLQSRLHAEISRSHSHSAWTTLEPSEDSLTSSLEDKAFAQRYSRSPPLVFRVTLSNTEIQQLVQRWATSNRLILGKERTIVFSLPNYAVGRDAHDLVSEVNHCTGAGCRHVSLKPVLVGRHVPPAHQS